MIHSSAIIEDGAQIHEKADIGPFCVIGPHVKIDAGTWVGPHVVINGRTEIGKDNRIFQSSSIGEIPQDLKYSGEETILKIGSRNTIREFVTIHLGTEGGGGITRVGDGNTFMACCHVAHDCVIEDAVIMANGATLGGHVHVEKHAILGGLVGVHQFVKIGQYAMIGGLSGVSLDIPPYTSSAGFRTKLYGLNLVGLKRHGFSADSLNRLKESFGIIFKSGQTLQEAVEQVEREVEQDPHVEHLVQFLKSSTRGFCR